MTELWRELGFEQQLRRVFRSSYREFDLEAVVRILVFNCLCDPQSKLGVLRWLERVYLPGVAVGGLHHERLMRAMDALIERREAVEQTTASLLRPCWIGISAWSSTMSPRCVKGHPNFPSCGH